MRIMETEIEMPIDKAGIARDRVHAQIDLLLIQIEDAQSKKHLPDERLLRAALKEARDFISDPDVDWEALY